MDKGHTVFGGMEGVRNSSALNSLDGGGDGMGDVVVGGSGGMASGGVSVTSDDVVAGNITQSEIVIDSAKAGRTRKRVENLGLKVTLGVLMLAIVGLGVGVGVNGRSDRLYSVEEVGSRAYTLRTEIEGKMGSNYGIDEAVAEFENEFEKGDDNWKIVLALQYAEFIYENTDDIQRAITVALKAESVLNDYFGVNYYKVLERMCRDAGADELADYYANMATKYVKYFGIHHGFVGVVL